MTSPVATKALQSVHDTDPKKLIWEALKGRLDKIEPTSGDAIVCVYERPEKVKHGTLTLIVPDTADRRSEDKFQGIVGLLVKVGPTFNKHRGALGLDPPLQVGDWVAFRNQDCHSFVLGDRAMRMMEGHFIRFRLADPDIIV